MAAAGTHSDKLDDDLTDDDLESEIELVSALVVAATSNARSLRHDEVDQLLGLASRQQEAGAESDSRPCQDFVAGRGHLWHEAMGDLPSGRQRP